MPETFATLADRVARLEADNRELRRLLTARDRQSRLTQPDPVRWVVLKAAGGTLTYPDWPETRLPAIFLDQVDGDDPVERDTSSQYKVASPIWIPPGLIVPVVWHAGLYWVLDIPPIFGTAAEEIAADAAGDVTPYVDGSAGSQDLEAHHDWMTGSTAIAADTELVVQFRRDLGQYSIINAACPAEA